MNRDTADIVATQFDLTCMKACAQRQTNLLGRVAKCQGTAHGAPRAVERC